MYGAAAFLSAELRISLVEWVWGIRVPILEGSLTLLAFSLLILSFSGGLWARWMDVRVIKRIASEGGVESGGR